MHRSRRQIAAVVFQIIERRGLSIDRRISWGPMKGTLKVHKTGYRVQGSGVRSQETGDKDQKMQSKKNLYVTLNPEPWILDPALIYAMTGSRSWTETTREQPGSSMVMP